MDIINTIALRPNSDNKHCLSVFQNHCIRTMTLADLDYQATLVAVRLKTMGVAVQDRIGVMGKNCLEWVLLDLAIIKLGGITAGFDIGRFDAITTIQRYGLKLIFVEQPTQNDPRILSFAIIAEWASSVPGRSTTGPLHGGYKTSDVLAIKFTSGSTGPAKGMEAIVAGINDTLSSVQVMFEHGDHDNILVFLRLAQLQQRYWIYSALAFHHHVTITTLDFVFLVAQAVRPTVVMGVPGFFEDVKRQLEADEEFRGEDIVERRHAIQGKFGGRIRYLWTGSAPATRAMLHFYNDCGVPMCQGYGLNETCIVAKNSPKENRLGSVGRILPNQSVRFDSQGVLIVKSKHPIIKNYSWCSPGDNERVFMPSGEIKTYDLGYIDEDGYLFIQGRIDDLIVLSTGRNVSVAPIEERVKLHPSVQECVLYGNGRPFVTALISPIESGKNKTSIEEHIRTLNESLWPEQKILGLVIAPEQFSIENGLLTSQFKPRRKEIYSRLEPEIEATYERAGVPWRGAYGQ